MPPAQAATEDSVSGRSQAAADSLVMATLRACTRYNWNIWNHALALQKRYYRLTVKYINQHLNSQPDTRSDIFAQSCFACFDNDLRPVGHL